jgi:multidrug efflux system membrane fusion protein
MKRSLINSTLPGGLLLALCVSTSAYAQQYDAVLQWSKRATLTTLTSGVIEKVAVDVGSHARQGELLLQLDAQVLEKRVKQTQAAVKSAEENFLEAKREKERAEELYNRTVLSDHDLQVAKINEIHARAQFEDAQVQHERAKYNLKYSRIVAPFNVLVLERHAQPGQVVSSEIQPPVLLVVAESDTMRARILVKEDALGTISLGKAAIVRVGGAQFSGKVVAAGFEPLTGKDGAVQGYPVEVEFASGDQTLRAGLTATVEIQ